jgi:hypothetical protein
VVRSIPRYVTHSPEMASGGVVCMAEGAGLIPVVSSMEESETGVAYSCSPPLLGLSSQAILKQWKRGVLQSLASLENIWGISPNVGQIINRDQKMPQENTRMFAGMEDRWHGCCRLCMRIISSLYALQVPYISCLLWIQSRRNSRRAPRPRIAHGHSASAFARRSPCRMKRSTR